MNQTFKDIKLNLEATQEILTWVEEVYRDEKNQFEAAKKIVKRLGAYWVDGRAEIGFWTPEVVDNEIPSAQLQLEIFVPVDEVDLQQRSQTIRFQRQNIPTVREGDFTWAVVEGITPGSENQLGTLYQLFYRTKDGQKKIIRDHLANSIPFGAFAPAELYDIRSMLDSRTDKAHFANSLDTKPDPDGVERVQFPSNILQIHIRYATQEGTLAALTRLYQNIAEKIRNDEPLSPAEQHYVAYDAVQLMPIEPIIEYESGNNFWQITSESDDEITVEIKHPDMTNWGYDVVISVCDNSSTILRNINC